MPAPTGRGFIPITVPLPGLTILWGCLDLDTRGGKPPLAIDPSPSGAEVIVPTQFLVSMIGKFFPS
jgi:hypothetical protein